MRKITQIFEKNLYWISTKRKFAMFHPMNGPRDGSLISFPPEPDQNIPTLLQDAKRSGFTKTTRQIKKDPQRDLL